VIFEMMTGRLPFESDNNDDLAAMRINQDPPSPRAFNPEISIPLENIMLKVLSREPSQRYRTADQLGQVLATFSKQPDNLYATPPPLSKIKSDYEIPGPSTTKKTPIIRNNPKVKNVTRKVDWKTIWLELACIFFAGGLIPFWLYVWLTIRSFTH
jgi:serine/threonine-protein kinase